MNEYSTRSTCRLCGFTPLTPLFSLGDQYVSTFHDGRRTTDKPVPIEIVLCRNCSLVQQKYTAPQEILYRRFYWYRSGVTETMRRALADVAKAAAAVANLQAGDMVLDIGSNDGTLLRSYDVPGILRVGVEPATNLAAEGSQGIDVFIGDFWDYETFATRLPSQHAKVITALGMFYDLEDPSRFVQDVAAALSPDGVFVAQLMCLKNMLALKDAGNLAHEHLEFYSLRSLQRLYGQHGLRIVDIQTNAVNGESYRIFAVHDGYRLQIDGAGNRVATAAVAEAGFDDPDFFKEWFAQLEANKAAVVNFVKEAVASGKRIFVYGASTKGNVLLQYYGLDRTLITAAADRSPEKWGKFTVGTNIPIVSEAEARAAKPDYFLVLPYAFLQEFLSRESRWRNSGGRFIVPLPEFRIV